jgi:hypothetical protein
MRGTGCTTGWSEPCGTSDSDASATARGRGGSFAQSTTTQVIGAQEAEDGVNVVMAPIAQALQERHERRWGKRAQERDWRPREREYKAEVANHRCAPREGVNQREVFTQTLVSSALLAQEVAQEEAPREAVREVEQEGVGERVEAAREGAQEEE